MTKKKSTLIINYGMGNSKSIANMLRKIGYPSEITTTPDNLAKASKIIIPGVGSFDNAMINLQNKGFSDALHHLVLEKKVPVLGICLGMHLLANESEEGTLLGFGWIQGKVKKFRFDTSTSTGRDNLKIPHMGWNTVMPAGSDSSLFHNIPQPMRFYFVHSYHFDCSNPDFILGTSRYGYDFTCAVRRDNIIGVQFHPEKSHKFGMQLLKNFVELT